VSPHAGYVYSGPAAACAFARLAEDGIPQLVVLLGLSHRAAGPRAALSSLPTWLTPLGEIAIEKALGEELLTATRLVAADDAVHASEHSLEVQLPFLQFLYGPGLRILPLCLSSRPGDSLSSQKADVLELGEALARALSGRDAVLVASTDFSHYVSQARAQQQDRLALNRILELDGPGLLQTVHDHAISMCGDLPVATALVAAERLGAARAELLRYYTSGDITGDQAEVVGYGSLAILRSTGREK
jgi:hypothetical protein